MRPMLAFHSTIFCRLLDPVAWRGRCWMLIRTRIQPRCIRCRRAIARRSWCFAPVHHGSCGTAYYLNSKVAARLCCRCARQIPHAGETGEEYR